ncbi:dihydrolipoyl dehydrogenase [Mesorhizobium kowhaii]|uniref:Dihydrolipoyl dehydrogenase n=1 Tax=Mesorhizobium kowhaii TaxID=1300272 RepID=A0A2W7D1X9_9HYPH|nr:dihydrolipoyl dehydrogenase [Mesorhizobium kowhaii]PZV40109.1 dihydrolipoyl dehydrogenase [Mesorhizobium kowhaii]
MGAAPPNAATNYDLVVIGSGVGGYTAANRAGQLGLKTACVEGAAVLGGTCLNVGCIPSKALLHASELFDLARTKFAGFGIKVSPELDLPTMMVQKQASVDALGHGIEFLFHKNKVDRIDGWARLAGPGKVQVRKPDGSDIQLTTRHVVIATGSIPTPLAGVTVDQVRIVDSTAALTLREVPKKLLVIGAGSIGLELGSVWRRLGAEVQVVEFLDHIIPGADAAIASACQKMLEKQGFAFRLSTKVLRATAHDATVSVDLEGLKDGIKETVNADVVLVAVGRRPFVGDLGLETVNLALDDRGFIPTQNFATSALGVWAIGDVTAGPMLAHKAEDEGVACVEVLSGLAGSVDYSIIPSVIYTSPEVAWVGLTEDQVKSGGRPYKLGRFPFSANSRAKLQHEGEGFVKVISSTDDYRILGVHMIGPQVSEFIGEACLAMEFHADSEDVARTCHPHPTGSEALRQAAMSVDGWMTQA